MSAGASIRRRLTPGLRTKLLLVALALLVVPWAGYNYILQMETYLRDAQENAQLATARAIARVMHERPKWFEYQGDILRAAPDNRHQYIRPLRSPIQLDGYADDWAPYADREQNFAGNHLLKSRRAYSPSSLSFKLRAGSDAHYLYLLFKVTDDRLVYRDPGSLRLDQSDHLRIALQDPQGNYQRYFLTTTAPGWVNAHRMPLDADNHLPEQPEVRIKGEWQETADGYILELRMPLEFIGARLAFAIGDVDDAGDRSLAHLVGTAGTEQLEKLGTVMVASPEMERLLQGLEHGAGRVWVVDRDHRVLALAGSLDTEAAAREADATEQRSLLSGLLHGVYRLVLKQPAREFHDELSSASRLKGPEIESALNGTAAAQWRQTPDQRVAIVSAAHPVWSGEQVLGAVIVEQTSNSILLLQNRAFENLFNTSLLAFVIAAVALLIFAARLSARVRRLRDDAERAIGPDGRVQGTVRGSRAGDEIGDLSRSFAEMLERLGQYTRYLETMAGKLSHELRTPLTVVRSSLDNLEMTELDEDARVYTRRAGEGLERLKNILDRLSEATRLEQALQQSERIPFDLVAVARGCIEGYQLAHPREAFTFEGPQEACTIIGVPDLIAQLIDKLVSNALDFRREGTAIEVELQVSTEHALLRVRNQGPALPDAMQGNLFDSMVTLREERGTEPHLGLGLYIVRLISEFHYGKVEARSRHNPEGAEFVVSLPFAPDAR